MILGLISDLHGNSTALAAVLDDGRRLGVQCWWVLGDLVALGPDPVGVLETLDGLSHVECISGNTERYVVTGDRPFPRLDDVRADPRLLDQLVEVEASFSWTRGMVTNAGWLDFLATLPDELRLDLPDGTRILGVHATLSSDDGQGIDTSIGDDDLAQLLAGCNADVVIAGHTHDVTDRTVGSIRAINLGSLSNPKRTDRCATYAVLRSGVEGHTFESRVVDYDHGEELRALERAAHPAADYIRRFHEAPGGSTPFARS